MKSLAELFSITLNTITIFIPIFFSINIIISLKNDDKISREVSKTSNIVYDIVFVVALSLIYNTQKIIKTGIFWKKLVRNVFIDDNINRKLYSI